MIGSRMSLTGALLAVAALAVAGCQPRNEYAPPPPPAVEVAHPIERPVTEYLEFTGTTRSFSVVDLRARVRGYLETIHFEDGARVEEGQILFTIEQAPFRAQVRIAQAELLKARAEHQLAEQELGRLTQLMRRNAVTTQELEIERARRDSAAAVVQAAEAALSEAELQLGYTEVRAPITGRIGRRLVDVGNLVQAEQTHLATLEGYDPVYVYFTISEGDLLDLRSGETSASPIGTQALEMRVGGEQEYPHEGRLDFTDLGVDPDTGTMQLRGVFPNPDRRILSGLYAKVRTAVGSPQSRLLVPERALGADQKGDYVLIVNAEDTVEYRTVELGRRFEGMRVVTGGLTGEEWVVVNGLQLARPGAQVQPERGEVRSEGVLAVWSPIDEPRPDQTRSADVGPQTDVEADDSAPASSSPATPAATAAAATTAPPTPNRLR